MIKRCLNVYAPLVWAMLLAFGSITLAVQEQPGQHAQEHPGEHPGKESEPVTADMIRQGILSHIQTVTAKNDGVFPIRDEKTGQDLKLEFVKVHDNVSVIKGETYFACTDFKDQASGNIYDLDFWMKRKDGAMKVVETKIHKVNGEPRYTYKDDEIAPVQE
ncbi:MAG: hypothetical protein HY314_09165 [Acidobacteria bacterium]|nr:hypothetical protein [Acidobacteriota bacterium]